jgi:hypothetical protein
VPAVIALFFRFVREPGRPVALALALAGMDLAFVHPTYALFVAIPLLGFSLVRLLVSRSDFRAGLVGLAAYGLPVIGVFAWLEPIVSQTLSHNPTPRELAISLRNYAADLVVHSPSSYHLAPSVPARTGAIAVAALVLAPLAVVAARRRWSAFVLGGMVLVLAIELWSPAFVHFSNLVSLSQSRRAAGFIPLAFALVGGAAVLARALRIFVLPLALAAGIALQIAWPGDFGKVVHTGPGLATWIALFGCLAAIVVVLLRRGRDSFESSGTLAALAVGLFVLPVVVHGFATWNRSPQRDANALTPGLVRFLRTRVPQRAVVFADLETSYRISAYVPVYVANGPPSHVANTRANDPAARQRALLRFLRTHDLAIPRSYGAGWLVLARGEQPGRGARLVYRDARFRVYRL